MAGEQKSQARRAARRRAGRRRQLRTIPGVWGLGKHQFDFMVETAGLTPQMKLLDVGCGTLRGGVHFVRYLETANYYGIEREAERIDAGLTVELPRADLEGQLPRENLLCTDDFGAWRFETEFDRALAQSVWTHIPFNTLQRSLFEVGRVLKPDGAFYATIFLCEDEDRLFEPIEHQPGGFVTYRDRDPFHYTWTDIVNACQPLGLEAELIGDWGHPSAQQMVRVSPAAGA